MEQKRIVPQKLSPGEEVRVISPARSMSIISSSVRSIALKRLQELGLKVSFSKHCEENDTFHSSSVRSRLEDLHDAFSDTKVKAILTTIGGYNSIQLLSGIDYKLIQKNPKILCGYSDITTLQNAIFAQTGLVTFSGPHFSTFGCVKGIEYAVEYFQKCLFSDQPFEVSPSDSWSDDEWYLEQEKRIFMPNPGLIFIQPGKAKGTIIGGNMGSLTILQGTDYMPSLHNSILFLEDNYPMTAEVFDRHLHALILQKDFQFVKGIVIGRFQKESNISMDALATIIHSKNELRSMPVIAGADFGHTMPLFTFPIGGIVEMDVSSSMIKLKISSAVI
ncbi:MAG TPA: S66 peptidase family protein [Waddliaceae bacterium]